MTVKLTVLARACALGLLASMLVACNTGFGRSGNNDIEDLDIENVDLDPSFDEDTFEYDAEVSRGTTSVTVEVELDDEDTATMTLNGEALESGVERVVPLELGDNDLVFVVTAENESTQTYTVTIDRTNEEADDATLSALSLPYIDLDPSFTSSTSDYSADVSYFVNSTRVELALTDDLATALLGSPSTDDDTLDEDTPSSWFELSLTGSTSTTTTVEINVHGDEGVEEDYTVEVTRSPKEDLSTAHYIKASNTDDDDAFGSAISISGDTFVVGAPKEESLDEDDETDNAGADVGAAYVFVKSGDTWEQQQYIKAPDDENESDDLFGTALAIDEDLLAVGAPGANNEAGQVHIYSRSNTVWSYETTLEATTPNDGDEFGYSVALAGDYLIVGAPGWSSGQGKVYAFLRDGDDDDWEENTITGGEGAAAGVNFGAALSISLGSTEDSEPEFIAGVPNTPAGGAVYLFEYDDSDDAWAQQEVMTAENGDSGDGFGTSVAILFDRIAVGAPTEKSDETEVNENATADEDDDSVDNAGAVYIFARESEDDAFEQEVYLKASQAEANYFGKSVALSSDMVAVGAPWEDSGSIGIEQDDEDDSEDFAGAVYVFSFSDTDDDRSDNDFENWTYEVYVKSSGTEEDDRFGQALAFFGSVLLVGATGENSGTTGIDTTPGDSEDNSGAVFVVED